ncbi:MAG TPA: helix-turn-helix domain-containing protein [Smithellaceae bacterium]|jgi:hypothetical protein|nr:helix-turn-helix domain-containing protein [Smithellaceae bacterium]
MGRQNQTKPDINVVSDAQQAAITALLAGQTTEQAAAAAGVTRQTVSQWRNHDVAFRIAYHTQREDVLQTSLDALRSAGMRAVGVLVAELDNPEVSVRLAAARAVLQAWSALRDDVRACGSTNPIALIDF